jgi:hypothetical protein
LFAVNEAEYLDAVADDPIQGYESRTANDEAVGVGNFVVCAHFPGIV